MSRLKFWQRKHWISQERSKQLGLFAFFWFVGVFCFFTIAVTKLPSYVLPLMPSSAILVALLWNDVAGGAGSREQGAGGISRSLFFWSGWVNVVFLSALAIALFHVSQVLGQDPAAPNFRQLLLQSGLPTHGGIILLVCATVIAFGLIRRLWHSLITVNLLAFVAFLVFVLTPALFLMDHERQLPLRELSAIAVQAQKPSEELVMVGFKKPSVVFYTERKVTYIKSTKATIKYLQEQSANKVQPPSLLLLTQPVNFPQIGLSPRDYENLGVRGAYELIRVRLKQ
jgi:4-amino-4-deoxy-L-arabinose transferase-like glycosyltransferase